MFRDVSQRGAQWKVWAKRCLFVASICLPMMQAQAQQSTSSQEEGVSVLQKHHLESNKELNPLDFLEKGESESSRKEMEDIVRAGPSFEEATVEVYVTGLDRKPLDLKEVTKIELCAQKLCVPADLTGRVRAVSSEGMETAVLLGTNHMPAGTLTHVRLYAQNRQGDVVVSEARLPEPWFLQYMANRAKLLLGLQGNEPSPSEADSQKRAALVSLKTVSASYVYEDPSASYLFYNPLMGVSHQLNHGVQLEMPAGALKRPHVFVVMVDDTGGLYPDVVIAPTVKLKKPFQLRVPPFADHKLRLENRLGDPDAASLANVDFKTVSISIWDTEDASRLNFEAMFRPGQKTGRDFGSTFRAQRAGLSSCLNLIKDVDFQEKMDLSLKTGGMFHLPSACTDVPPFVHMVVTNAWSMGGGGSYDVVYRSLTYRPLENEWVLTLSRLNSYQGFRVLINGFTWRGDKGVFINSAGIADGFVKGYNYETGHRFTIGSNEDENGQPAGRKFVAVFHSSTGRSRWSNDWRLMSGHLRGWANDIPVVISSSTSILRDGVCSGGNDRNRWSAVGETPEGKMVFLSSTSTGETTGAELCQVFIALGVRNAIRLDGGSAAGMIVNGQLLNRLRRVRDLIFAPTRRIAWAFVYR
ncbi:MAG: phosphodiester glycosidase family protein [Lautropia sp.]|nr:phosphodiester glycosidase family protein [Lautropia sp.]